MANAKNTKLAALVAYLKHTRSNHEQSIVASDPIIAAHIKDISEWIDELEPSVTAAQRAGQEPAAWIHPDTLAMLADGKSGRVWASEGLQKQRVPLFTHAAPVNGGERVEDKFIAIHGHRLALLLGIEAYDIADRDAKIMAVLHTADAQQVDAWTVTHYADLGEIRDAQGKHVETVYGGQADRIVAAHNAALTSPAKVGTVAQVTPEEQAEINAALDRDDELACSSCGLTMAQSRALTSPAKVGGDEREKFNKWASGFAWFGKNAKSDAWDAWQARAALSADGGEDKRDAERYRQIRRGEPYTVTVGKAKKQVHYIVSARPEHDYGEALDRTTDAAIAANQAKEDA